MLLTFLKLLFFPRDLGFDGLSFWELPIAAYLLLLVSITATLFGKYIHKKHPNNIGTRTQKYNDHFYAPKQTITTQQKETRWNAIELLFKSRKQNDWKVAILDSDVMLDELLQNQGMNGETVGEKLKNASEAGIAYVEEMWQVHKLRNQLAHEGSDYKLDPSIAWRTFLLYQKIFTFYKLI
jgi:hypothetical protein